MTLATPSVGSSSSPSRYSDNLKFAWNVRHAVANEAARFGVAHEEIAHILDGIAPPTGEPAPVQMAEARKARANPLGYLRAKVHPTFGVPTPRVEERNGDLVVSGSGMTGISKVYVKVAYPTRIRDFTPPTHDVRGGSVKIVRPGLLEGTAGEKVTVHLILTPETPSPLAIRLGVPPAEPVLLRRDIYVPREARHG